MFQEQKRNTRVFISYARADSSEIAEELVNGLKLAGFDAYLDKHDIDKAESWEQRLYALIVRADAVVFLISPAAVHSNRCAWEVDKALKFGKRLVPVEWIAVPEAEVPDALKRLNYIFLSNATSITKTLGELAETLRKDIGWIRAQTLIGEQAVRWQSESDRRKAKDLLFRGSELAEAQAWAGRRQADFPPITDLQSTFLAESAKEEVLHLWRSRRTRAILAALSVLVLAGLISWWQQKPIIEAYLWRSKMKPTIVSGELERQYAKATGTEFSDCAIGCPVMVTVPAGKFSMGSADGIGLPREHPLHEVEIPRPLAVGKFVITFEEWDWCAKFGTCQAGIVAGDWGRGRQPAINVSWLDAQSYVHWLSRMTGKTYHLLSEAEWEYVARAGSTTHFSYGNDDAVLGEYAWFSENAEERPHPVGERKPNRWGFYDVHGNVAEWVEDCFRDNYAGAPSAGSARLDPNCVRRVIRGGAFLYDAVVLRSASRDWLEQDQRKDFVGFRIARELTAK